MVFVMTNFFYSVAIGQKRTLKPNSGKPIVSKKNINHLK